MGLFLLNTSRVIPPALVLSSLLLLIPFLPWLYIPRNASPTLAAVSPAPHLEDAVLPRKLCKAPSPPMEGGRSAGRASSPPSPPVIPEQEQQQGVDSNSSSEGERGLLIRTRALLSEVEISADVLGPILVAMPLKDLTSRPLALLQSLVVATVAGVLWRSLCGKVIPGDSTQAARRTLLQLRRNVGRLDLEGGSVLQVFSTHLKLILFRLGVDALSSLVSGSLVWILVFWACMPATSRIQFQIPGVLNLLVALGGCCLIVIEILAIEIIWLKTTLFLKRLRHQPARCHGPCPGNAEELADRSAALRCFTSPA